MLGNVPRALSSRLECTPLPIMAIRYRRVAGIDPGAATGLVALLVPVGGAPLGSMLDGARWLASTQLRIPGGIGFTDCENDARLFQRIREWLRMYAIESVALEEPWDAIPQRLQSRGTSFALGKAYGLALAAANDLGARCMSYPVTSTDAKPSRNKKRLVEARTGWMPTWRRRERSALLTQDRDITLAELHELSVTLRARPANGLLSSVQRSILSEDERMALGVLRFHLLRQPTFT